MKHYLSALSLALVISTSVSSAALAAKDENRDLKDDNYVSLSGTVGKILDADEFELNYGTGIIKVDMDESWENVFAADKTSPASLLKTGDKVTVVGTVDKHWLTENEIDAEALTFNSGKHLITYSNPEKAESLWDRGMSYFKESGQISVSGEVTKINNDHEFMLQYAGGTIQVDTDPVKVPANKPIKVGDHITVVGNYDKGITESNEIQAKRIYRGENYSQK